MTTEIPKTSYTAYRMYRLQLRAEAAVASHNVVELNNIADEMTRIEQECEHVFKLSHHPVSKEPYLFCQGCGTERKVP